MRLTFDALVIERPFDMLASKIKSLAFDIPAINKPIIKITIEISTREKAFLEFLFRFVILIFILLLIFIL
jgi:hypothetical protein